MATTVQIRVDDTMKKDADKLFSNLGLDISTAFRMFLSACLRQRGLPFQVKENLAAPAEDPYAGRLPAKLTKKQKETLDRIFNKGPAGFSVVEKKAALERLDGCLADSKLTLDQVRTERIARHAGLY
jgi:addiction module RelB/DinJ family antitoxin